MPMRRSRHDVTVNACRALMPESISLAQAQAPGDSSAPLRQLVRLGKESSALRAGQASLRSEGAGRLAASGGRDADSRMEWGTPSPAIKPGGAKPTPN